MRDLVRNNPHAAKAVAVLVNNIIGAGIMPRAASGDDTLDRKVDALFERWTADCDADGQLDFYGMQTLICREMVEAGEVLVPPPPASGGGWVAGAPAASSAGGGLPGRHQIRRHRCRSPRARDRVRSGRQAPRLLASCRASGRRLRGVAERPAEPPGSGERDRPRSTEKAAHAGARRSLGRGR